MTRFFRASGMLAVGFALGVLVGGAGTATAVMGKKGWDRWGSMFKQGYVAGFLDVVRMAKTSDPQGFVAKTFRLPPSAKAIHWVAEIDELYAEKGNENRPLPQMFAIAGPKLEAKFGSEADADRKRFERLNKPKKDAKDASDHANAEPKLGPDASPERIPKETAGKPDPQAASAASASPAPEKAADGANAGGSDKPAQEAKPATADKPAETK